jgi:hypothetical protein
MRRGPEDLTFSATAGGIFLATSVALMLIIYALLTFVALLPPSAARQLVGPTDHNGGQQQLHRLATDN